MSNGEADDSTSEFNKRVFTVGTGLVLPGLFGAEIVFVLQSILHDATHAVGALQEGWWLIARYMFGLWFAVYVCTGFMVTVHAGPGKYSVAMLRRDVIAALGSFVALAMLGFVEADLSGYGSRHHGRALATAFLAVIAIAILAGISDWVGNVDVPRRVKWARVVGSGISVVGIVWCVYSRGKYPQLEVGAIVLVAVLGCILWVYQKARWQGAEALRLSRQQAIVAGAPSPQAKESPARNPKEEAAVTGAVPKSK